MHDYLKNVTKFTIKRCMIAKECYNSDLSIYIYCSVLRVVWTRNAKKFQCLVQNFLLQYVDIINA